MSSTPSSSRPKRPADSPDVKLSKSLSYILRHGAVKEKVPMRADGYICLKALKSHNKFRNAKNEDIARVVRENSKQRFTLTYKPDDPSVEQPEFTSASVLEDWFIRANQGHSLTTVEVELTPLLKTEDFPENVIHGTSRSAWEKIQASNALSKMNRNHIHMAPGKLGDEGVISGMRASSDVYIYIDYEKALADGIKFFKSTNGVILSPGNEKGEIPLEYVARTQILK
ncbi:hypothetical protein DV495_000760 [Geotrichum candidum]|uniref:2'-phosphotransferase n=1 Tax=Geotrichum candidum TaxID=1173061 RepID=A0A0J9XDX3_GEOCN|nr:hypothetical protein DV454_004990 [Geotrichum candidum]KAI9213667.1 hypothetical protein DS838_001455 [Geotrichum bryndzae]KAF5112528.1 hypothetical protein DV452_004001 [Geotrichum candidum]KAF5135539.1 hypothetical protein DV495_000760 [Geotrichum candidum]KAF7501422.1 hypothetical protein DV113_000501 [Geotrichum candidum]